MLFYEEPSDFELMDKYIQESYANYISLLNEANIIINEADGDKSGVLKKVIHAVAQLVRNLITAIRKLISNIKSKFNKKAKEIKAASTNNSKPNEQVEKIDTVVVLGVSKLMDMKTTSPIGSFNHKIKDMDIKFLYNELDKITQNYEAKHRVKMIKIEPDDYPAPMNTLYTKWKDGKYKDTDSIDVRCDIVGCLDMKAFRSTADEYFMMDYYVSENTKDSCALKVKDCEEYVNKGYDKDNKKNMNILEQIDKDLNKILNDLEAADKRIPANPDKAAYIAFNNIYQALGSMLQTGVAEVKKWALQAIYASDTKAIVCRKVIKAAKLGKKSFEFKYGTDEFSNTIDDYTYKED